VAGDDLLTVDCHPEFLIIGPNIPLPVPEKQCQALHKGAEDER
jgi:hypothetical protein